MMKHEIKRCPTCNLIGRGQFKKGEHRTTGMLGHKHSLKTREKLKKAWNYEKHITSQFREKQRTRRLGKPALTKGMKGKWHLSDSTKNKMALAKIGNKSWTGIFGKNHPAWRGGIAFEPYSSNWTLNFKRMIREQDNYTCRLCKKYPANHIHHADYDKKNCNPNNLFILCHSCHMKTNGNRKYWTNYFKNFVNKRDDYEAFNANMSLLP